MCGISGKLYFDPARPVERPVLERMNAVLAHRGPDDAGIHCDGPIGFAHRRLSIIDLSPAGRQPMSNEDGTIWIVFNGEIYNFQSLRPDLVRRGIGFGPTPTRKSSSISTKSTGSSACGFSAGCSPWPSGTVRAANSFSRGTGWEEAAQLPTGWGRLPVCLRGEGDPAGSRRADPSEPGRDLAVSDLWLRTGIRVGFSGDPQASTWPLLDLLRRPGEGSALLAASPGSKGATVRSGLVPRDRGAAGGSDAPSDDQRCPAGRVPERRHRLQRRGRVDESVATGPVKTFSIGFEEPEYDELRVRSPGGRAIPDGPSRVRGPTGCGGDPPATRLALRRAVCGLLGGAHVLCGPDDANARDRGADRGRRGRELRRV